MNNTKIMKMDSLLNDDAFVNQLQEVSSRNDLLTLFRAHGVDVTDEEFQDMAQEGCTILKEIGHLSDDGELSPELLDLVSGGARWGAALLCFVLAAASAYVGYPQGTVIMVVCGVAALAS